MSVQFFNYLYRLKEYEYKMKYSDSLGITMTEFKDRWKEKAELYQHPTINIKEKNTSGKLLEIKVDKSIILMCDIINHEEEKIIKSITMIASGDGTFQSGVNILISIGILLDCLNPDLEKEKRNELIEKLGIKNPESNKGMTIIDKEIKYSFKVSKQIGVWFSISRNKKDKRD